MGASSAVSAVLAGLDRIRNAQEEFYRTLHQNPELSHQEHGTAAAVAEGLRQTGFQVHQGIGGTGVVGLLANGAGATVLLRADMDACRCGKRPGCRTRAPPRAPTPMAIRGR